jgi:hypothetical protein
MSASDGQLLVSWFLANRSVPENSKPIPNLRLLFLPLTEAPMGPLPSSRTKIPGETDVRTTTIDN